MNRSRKFALIVFACAGIVMAILATAVLTAHLFANRERAKSSIIEKVDQATGGELDYDRLAIRIFPVPHLTVRNIILERKEGLRLTAHALALYPRILPMLKGQVRIRRLMLSSPEIALQLNAPPGFPPDHSQHQPLGFSAESVKESLQRFFSGLATLDPQSEFKMAAGSLMLRLNDEKTLHITRMNTHIEREKEHLSMRANGSLNLGDEFRLMVTANLNTQQARGRLTGTNMNIRPLIPLLSIPNDIRTADTQAQGTLFFSLNSPDNLHGRFDLQFPSLKVMRKDAHLELQGLELSGVADFTPNGCSLALKRVHLEKPALNLTAAATLFFQGEEKDPVVELKVSTEQLDVAVAGATAHAIAGDLDVIKTAFAVARQGLLTDVKFSAAFESSEKGFHCVSKKASGHLAKGWISIPGIWADLEKVDGNIIYEDRHVAFKQIQGHFKGADVKKLDATIDWQKSPVLSIASPSVSVELKTFHVWLTSFEKIAAANDYVSAVTGTAKLSTLTIEGPLAEPENWVFSIIGSPEKVTVHSPRIPFSVNVSGGNVTWIPGKEKADGVKVDFLDGSFISSYRSKGLTGTASTSFQVDGKLGQATLDWLSTILPIPDHLQIKPPVQLSKVHLLTDFAETFSLSGNIKTAGGVDLYGDVSRSPDALRIKRLQFYDGRSNATVAATLRNSLLDLSFSGKIVNETADRLLRKNRSLSGYLEGTFRALIDIQTPLRSTFTGHLNGEGVRVHGLLSKPFVVDQFFIEGSGRRLTLGPSRVSLLNSKWEVQGGLTNDYQRIKFNLDVEADTIGQVLISELQSIGKDNKEVDDKEGVTPAVHFEGRVNLNATDLSYGGFTWTPVAAQIDVQNGLLSIHIDKANLCGISTVGTLTVSPDGSQMQLFPAANDASLQETVACLGYEMDAAEAYYDLSGEINLPLSADYPALFMYGQVELTSDSGRILHSNVLMKILAILNVTEWFAGGRTDLKYQGYGYSNASVKAKIGGGKLVLEEILIDGHSLKLTGKGTVGLTDAQVDIIFLVTPFKTVDRVVKNLPLIGYITDGALVTIPVQVEGPIQDLNVFPIPPSEVGKGLMGLMERTLKSPFRLVERLSGGASKEVNKKKASPEPDSRMNGP